MSQVYTNESNTDNEDYDAFFAKADLESEVPRFLWIA